MKSTEQKVIDDAAAAETTSNHADALKQVQEQHMSTVKELAQLQRSSKTLSQERDDAKAEIDSLQGKLEALLTEHLEAKQTLAISHDEALSHLRQDRDDAKAETDFLQEKLTALLEDQSEAKASLTRTHEEALKALRASRDEATSAHRELQHQHTTALSQIQQLEQRLADFSSSINKDDVNSSSLAANNDQLHADLRKYMATLKRQYGTDVADLEALRRDIDAEGGRREEDWRKQEEMRAVIAAELGRIVGETGEGKEAGG